MPGFRVIHQTTRSFFRRLVSIRPSRRTWNWSILKYVNIAQICCTAYLRTHWASSAVRVQSYYDTAPSSIIITMSSASGKEGKKAVHVKVRRAANNTDHYACLLIYLNTYAHIWSDAGCSSSCCLSAATDRQHRNSAVSQYTKTTILTIFEIHCTHQTKRNLMMMIIPFQTITITITNEQ